MGKFTTKTGAQVYIGDGVIIEQTGKVEKGVFVADGVTIVTGGSSVSVDSDFDNVLTELGVDKPKNSRDRP